MASADRGTEENGTVAVSIAGSNLTSFKRPSNPLLLSPSIVYARPDPPRTPLPRHLARYTNCERTGPSPLPDRALSPRRGVLRIYLALCMLRRVERVDNHGSSDIYLSISSV
jgi:hypothetical protein